MAHAAEVVERQTIGDRADDDLVGDAVSLLLSPAESHHPVAVLSTDSALP